MQQQADLKPFLWFYALTFLLLAVIPICDALFIGKGFTALPSRHLPRSSSLPACAVRENGGRFLLA
jgi:hypothetical protein